MAESNFEWAKYDNLNSKKYSDYILPAGKDNYLALPTGKGFVQLTPAREGGDKYVAKMHISVPNDQVGKAWDAVVPQLAEQEMMAKVVTEESKPGLKGDKAGKTIVVYLDQATLDDPKKMNALINGVEGTLKENGITPGPKVVTDQPVKGSQYTHYRYGDTDYDKKTGMETPESKAQRGVLPEGQKPVFNQVGVSPEIQAKPIASPQVKNGPPPLPKPTAVSDRVETLPLATPEEIAREKATVSTGKGEEALKTKTPGAKITAENTAMLQTSDGKHHVITRTQNPGEVTIETIDIAKKQTKTQTVVIPEGEAMSFGVEGGKRDGMVTVQGDKIVYEHLNPDSTVKMSGNNLKPGEVAGAKPPPLPQQKPALPEAILLPPEPNPTSSVDMKKPGQAVRVNGNADIALSDGSTLMVRPRDSGSGKGAEVDIAKIGEDGKVVKVPSADGKKLVNFETVTIPDGKSIAVGPKGGKPDGTVQIHNNQVIYTHTNPNTSVTVDGRNAEVGPNANALKQPTPVEVFAQKPVSKPSPELERARKDAIANGNGPEGKPNEGYRGNVQQGGGPGQTYKQHGDLGIPPSSGDAVEPEYKRRPSGVRPPAAEAKPPVQDALKPVEPVKMVADAVKPVETTVKPVEGAAKPAPGKSSLGTGVKLGGGVAVGGAMSGPVFAETNNMRLEAEKLRAGGKEEEARKLEETARETERKAAATGAVGFIPKAGPVLAGKGVVDNVGAVKDELAKPGAEQKHGKVISGAVGTVESGLMAVPVTAVPTAVFSAGRQGGDAVGDLWAHHPDSVEAKVTKKVFPVLDVLHEQSGAADSRKASKDLVTESEKAAAIDKKLADSKKPGMKIQNTEQPDAGFTATPEDGKPKQEDMAIKPVVTSTRPIPQDNPNISQTVQAYKDNGHKPVDPNNSVEVGNALVVTKREQQNKLWEMEKEIATELAPKKVTAGDVAGAVFVPGKGLKTVYDQAVPMDSDAFLNPSTRGNALLNLSTHSFDDVNNNSQGKNAQTRMQDKLEKYDAERMKLETADRALVEFGAQKQTDKQPQGVAPQTLPPGVPTYMEREEKANKLAKENPELGGLMDKVSKERGRIAADNSIAPGDKAAALRDATREDYDTYRAKETKAFEDQVAAFNDPTNKYSKNPAEDPMVWLEKRKQAAINSGMAPETVQAVMVTPENLSPEQKKLATDPKYVAEKRAEKMKAEKDAKVEKAKADPEAAMKDAMKKNGASDTKIVKGEDGKGSIEFKMDDGKMVDSLAGENVGPKLKLANPEGRVYRMEGEFSKDGMIFTQTGMSYKDDKTGEWKKFDESKSRTERGVYADQAGKVGTLDLNQPDQHFSPTRLVQLAQIQHNEANKAPVAEQKTEVKGDAPAPQQQNKVESFAKGANGAPDVMVVKQNGKNVMLEGSFDAQPPVVRAVMVDGARTELGEKKAQSLQGMGRDGNGMPSFAPGQLDAVMAELGVTTSGRSNSEMLSERMAEKLSANTSAQQPAPTKESLSMMAQSANLGDVDRALEELGNDGSQEAAQIRGMLETRRAELVKIAEAPPAPNVAAPAQQPTPEVTEAKKEPAPAVAATGLEGVTTADKANVEFDDKMQGAVAAFQAGKGTGGVGEGVAAPNVGVNKGVSQQSGLG